MSFESEAVDLPVELQARCECGELMTRAWRRNRVIIYTHLARCAVVAALIEDADRKQAAEWRRNDRLFRSGIPNDDPLFGGDLAELKAATIHGMPALREDTRAGFELGERFLAVCRTGKIPRSGFCLLGAMGSGRTTFLRAFGRSLCALGLSVRYEECIPLYLRARTKASKGELPELVAELLRPDILLLDDLGREQPRGPFWVDEVLHVLMDRRKDRPIVCNSNKTYHVLFEDYNAVRDAAGVGPQNAAYLVDRLAERCADQELYGPTESLRRGRRDF